MFLVLSNVLVAIISTDIVSAPSKSPIFGLKNILVHYERMQNMKKVYN